MTRAERSKLDGLEMRTTGRAWQLGTDDYGQQVVMILRGDGSREPMYVKHDHSPAPVGDIEFVAHCREDVKQLVSALSFRRGIDPGVLRQIATRLSQTTPGSWQAFLESDHIGGSSIISFGEPEYGDLYLDAYGEPANDSDYEFVAAAHEALPRLLEQAESLDMSRPWVVWREDSNGRRGVSWQRTREDAERVAAGYNSRPGMRGCWVEENRQVEPEPLADPPN